MQGKQKRDESRRLDNALMRDKAQEIFDEIDQIIDKSRTASTDAMQRIFPNPPTNEKPISPVPDLGCLRGLVAIYYPICSPIIATFEANILQPFQNLKGELFDAMNDGENGAKNIKGIHAILVTTHNQLIERLAADLRAKIAGEVRKYIPNEL